VNIARSETLAAVRAARLAQKIADARTGAGDIKSKGHIDLVTGADVACEDAIRGELLRSFPDYPVVGEERGGTPVAGRPYWLVDPICGTRPYASDIPLYCTNIALVEDGEVTAAVVGIGKTGEVLYAESGRPAGMLVGKTINEIRASSRSDTLWIDGKTEASIGAMARAMQQRRWFVWSFSSSVAYAYAAMGKISGVIQFGLPGSHPDGSVHAAAGCFIARCAGARVTDVETGGPWNLRTDSMIIAADEKLERDLLDLARG
jgi:fructose-1,6-bisphosphatase/inositol monophosphatase family enzyme